MFNSLRPHGLQHAKLLCPPLSFRVCSNSYPLHQWCYLLISSSASPFSFCLQSFPESQSFPMNQFFPLGGQSIGDSASPIILPMTIQGWFPLGLTDLIILQFKRLFKSLLQHHNLKASILHHSAFFTVLLYVLSWYNGAYNITGFYEEPAYYLTGQYFSFPDPSRGTSGAKCGSEAKTSAASPVGLWGPICQRSTPRSISQAHGKQFPQGFLVIQGGSETQIQVFLPPAKPQSLFPVLGHLPKYDPVPRGLTDCSDGGHQWARSSVSLSPHSSLASLQNIKSFWPPSFLPPYSMPSQCPQGLATPYLAQILITQGTRQPLENVLSFPLSLKKG